MQGQTFDDATADYIIKKTGVLNKNKHNGGAGLNKQTMWFRKSSFQKWIDAEQ